MSLALTFLSALEPAYHVGALYSASSTPPNCATPSDTFVDTIRDFHISSLGFLAHKGSFSLALSNAPPPYMSKADFASTMRDSFLRSLVPRQSSLSSTLAAARSPKPQSREVHHCSLRNQGAPQYSAPDAPIVPDKVDSAFQSVLSTTPTSLWLGRYCCSSRQ